MISTQTKICGKCNQVLSLDCFHKHKRDKTGLQYWCKICRKEQNPEQRREYFKNRYHNNKDAYLDATYKRFYDITLKEYNVLLSSQDNVCKICNKSCPSGRRLAVDHEHASGKVRGLLCMNCNKGIGYFKDNIDLLRKAADYLND